MNIKKFTQQNRIAWNEASIFHAQAREGEGNIHPKRLDPVVHAFIEDHHLVEGKKVAHLCCNNGRETIALKKMGAYQCVGFDISDEAITAAKTLDVPNELKCHFIRTDVYDIPKDNGSTFDLVYISAGTLIWLPDIHEFFQIVYQLLEDRGGVLIYEIHPYIWMLEEAPKNNPLQLTDSYFKNRPVISYGGLDYIGHVDYKGERNYSFDHTISHIINSLIANHLTIKSYYEYPHDISACFSHLEKEEIKIPMSYILYGEKRIPGEEQERERPFPMKYPLDRSDFKNNT